MDNRRYILRLSSNIMIAGVDRSHLNSPLPLIQLVKQGVGFVFFKATQGETYQDATFNAAWQEIKAIPGNLSGQLLKRGAYHFYDPHYDGIAQAKNYLSRGINFDTPGCLPPWVDVEDLVGSNSADTEAANKWVADNWQLALSRLQDFLNYVKQQTGRDCGIYSYNGYMKEYLHGHLFPDNPFWLSSLQANCPVRYDTGKLPDFWQNTYNWNKSDMDGDFFTGDIQQLNTLANILT